MLFAPLAVLFKFQPIFNCLFVFFGMIIDSVAFRAFQFDEIVLGHRVG